MLLFVMEIAVSAEQARLAAVRQYGLGDLPPDPVLEDIARLAAELCHAPVAGIAVMEEGGARLVGRWNLQSGLLPHGTLPMESAMDSDATYQVFHAGQNGTPPIVLDAQTYAYLAASPVQTPGGVPIGCLWVADRAARKLSAAQMESLEALSHMVTTRLELIMRVRENSRGAQARQRVEAALTVEKNFVAAVLDTVGALVVVFDTAGRIVRFNRACEIISGYRAAEVVGRFAWERLIPQEDVPRYIEGFEEILEGKYPSAFENFWLASDGSRRRISWSATALLGSQGKVAYIIATGIDVTVQRVAENAIRESEARYRQIVEGSLGLVYTHDLEGRLLSMNQSGAQSFGRRVEEVLGHTLAEYVHPQRQHLIRSYFEALLSTGEAQGSMHLQHTSGEERVFAYRNRLVRPPQGAPYVLGFGIDITDQVRAEEQLRALIRQSDSVLEAVGDGIYGVDLEGCVTVVNPAAAQMLGYRPDELLGRSMHEMTHHTHADGAPYPATDCPVRSTVRNLATVRVATEVFWRKDGTSFPVEYVARPQIATVPVEGAPPGGATHSRAVGVVVAFTDISERNALDRMKDEFISTVSHELRTPLTSLRAALGLLSVGKLEERPEKARQMMEMAIGNADRLVRLVNDIMDLERIGSGKAGMHFTEVSVEQIFRQGVDLLHAQAARSHVHLEVAAQGVTVCADADRLLQTVAHLIDNAIRFSTASATAPSTITLRASLTGAEQALIEVEDHGRGIPADKLEIIFDRFKQVDASDTRTTGGTGMGLAICRAIIAQHGGKIWATSVAGQGSVFHFTLPTQLQRRLG